MTQDQHQGHNQGHNQAHGEQSQRQAWEFEAAETANLKVRTELMLVLQRHLRNQGWTLEQAAQTLSENPIRLENLINGEISRFTSEQLINLLAKVGLQVRIDVIPGERHRDS
jgi:predicted XRE-type DNA-binding protein